MWKEFSTVCEYFLPGSTIRPKLTNENVGNLKLVHVPTAWLTQPYVEHMTLHKKNNNKTVHCIRKTILDIIVFNDFRAEKKMIKWNLPQNIFVS